MDFPIRSSRTSVETREREPGSRDDRRGDEVCFAATHVFHPRPPACHRSRGRQGQALRVAAKSAAILDRHSTRWRSRTAVGAEEWLRWGQTKEWVRKQVSCQDFVITIREGRHQFSWHKKQEHSRIFPSDTVVVLIYALDSTTIDLCLSLFPWADFRSTKAAVKMHTLLDLRGPIPSFIHIS